MEPREQIEVDTLHYFVKDVMNKEPSPDNMHITQTRVHFDKDGHNIHMDIDTEQLTHLREQMAEQAIKSFGMHWFEMSRRLDDSWAIMVSLDSERFFIPVS